MNWLCEWQNNVAHNQAKKQHAH